MKVIKLTEGLLLEAPPPAARRARLLIDPEETGDEALSIGVSFYKPGDRAPKHSHDTGETMIVTAGAGVFTWDGGRVEAGPGTVLFSPAGEEHSIANEGTEMLEFLWIYAPAGGEQVLKRTWNVVEG